MTDHTTSAERELAGHGAFLRSLGAALLRDAELSEDAAQETLVRSLHAPGDLIEAARALAHELTDESAAVSIAMTRQMMWRMLGAAHPMEGHKMDSRAIWIRGQSDDAKEGVASFLEKRDADYPCTVSEDFPHLSPWMDEPGYK